MFIVGDEWSSVRLLRKLLLCERTLWQLSESGACGEMGYGLECLLVELTVFLEFLFIVVAANGNVLLELITSMMILFAHHILNPPS